MSPPPPDPPLPVPGVVAGGFVGLVPVVVNVFGVLKNVWSSAVPAVPLSSTNFSRQ